MKVLQFLEAEIRRQRRDGHEPTSITLGLKARREFLRDVDIDDLDEPTREGAITRFKWVNVFEDVKERDGYVRVD